MLPPSKGRSLPFPHSSQTGDLHITIHICDLCFLLVLRHRHTEGICDVVRVESRPRIDLYNLPVLVKLLFTLLRLLVENLRNIEVEDIENLSIKLVRFIYKQCGWQKKLTYRIPGVKYAPDSGLVVFDLRKAYEIHEGRMKEAEQITDA